MAKIHKLKVEDRKGWVRGIRCQWVVIRFTPLDPSITFMDADDKGHHYIYEQMVMADHPQIRSILSTLQSAALTKELLDDRHLARMIDVLNEHWDSRTNDTHSREDERGGSL